MSNPTSNFNWQMPTATDLVTDLPADFEVFGQAVDSSMADLLGGTTGQILAKNSNTNMDFVWITNDVGDITEVAAGTGISGGGTSGAVTITNSMATEITAKGDLIVGTGNAAFDNLPAGTNGHVLTADSTVSPTGLKWAAPSGGSNWTLLNAGGTALTGAQTITVSGISGADKVAVFVTSASSANASAELTLRLNGDTANAYYAIYTRIAVGASYNTDNIKGSNSWGTNQIYLAGINNTAAGTGSYGITLTGCNSSGKKLYSAVGGGDATSSQNGQILFNSTGYYDSASAISSISVLSTTGNLDAGTVYVYTSA
jgi:hypothetical protein